MSSGDALWVSTPRHAKIKEVLVMRNLRAAVAVLGLLGCLARPSAAAECEGVRMPDTASLGAHTLTLNG